MKQKGFTLIELLVALAVGGLVMMSAVAVIYQVMWGTSRTNSQVVALTDVHYAALRIKKDLVMAQTTDLTDGVPQDSATLSWTDYTSFDTEENKDHSSAYNLLSDGVLQRTYDYEKPSETTSIVGRNITSLEFTLNPNGDNDRVIKVVITATEGDFTPRSETLEFSVYLRTLGME
jgi:prepilin-type N-terminal cleavage/methylation domain-containing protein